MAAGLIKPAQRHDRPGATLEANQNGGGVYGPAFKPLQTWEGLRKKAKVSNRTREIWPSGIIGGFGKRKPWWDCEPVQQSKEQERKPPTYSKARPTSIPMINRPNLPFGGETPELPLHRVDPGEIDRDVGTCQRL
jgi:hypothetical protein